MSHIRHLRAAAIVLAILAFSSCSSRSSKIVELPSPNRKAESEHEWKQRNPFIYLCKELDEPPKLTSIARFVSQPSSLTMSTGILEANYLIEIDDTGAVSSYLAREVTGIRRVDSALVATLMNSRFEPAQYKGTPTYSPVAMSLTLTPADSGYTVASDVKPLLGGREPDEQPKDSVHGEEVYPTMTYQWAPEMPRDFLMKGRHTKVWVKCLLDEHQETPVIVCLQKSGGWKSCDMAALEAAMKCRFTPATMDGVPIECWVTFNYDFQVSQ